MKYEETQIGSVRDIPFVSKTPIIIHDRDSGYQAIVNEDTKDTISIVSNDYQLVPHRDVWAEIKKLRKKYKVDKGVLMNGGRVMMIEMVEADPTEIEITPGDKLEKRVRVFNSYDLSRALSVQSYGIRLICTNGAIAPGMIDRYHKVHTFNSVEISEISEHIKLGMESWAASGELLIASTKKVVVVEDALGHLKYLAGKYKKIVLENLDTKASVYDLWNELTRTLSHDIGPKVQTSTVIGAQQHVNKIFDLVRP